jgi:hypothetical protein
LPKTTRPKKKKKKKKKIASAAMDHNVVGLVLSSHASRDPSLPSFVASSLPSTGHWSAVAEMAGPGSALPDPAALAEALAAAARVLGTCPIRIRFEVSFF